MATPASTQQLQRLADDFAAVRRRFDALNARVTDAQWAQRPSAAEWSVAECIAHLNLTSAAMVPRVRGAFAEAKALGPVGERAYKGLMFGRMLARMVGPVPMVLGMRLGRTKTPPPFVPGSDLPRAHVVAEFQRWQEDERALLREAEGLAVDRVTMESPFVAGARYDAYSALHIMVRHEERHLVQAERALARLAAR